MASTLTLRENSWKKCQCFLSFRFNLVFNEVCHFLFQVLDHQQQLHWVICGGLKSSDYMSHDVGTCFNISKFGSFENCEFNIFVKTLHHWFQKWFMWFNWWTSCQAPWSLFQENPFLWGFRQLNVTLGSFVHFYRNANKVHFPDTEEKEHCGFR